MRRQRIRALPTFLALCTSVGFACASPDLTSPDYSTVDWLQTEIDGVRVLTNARPEVAVRALKKLSRFLMLANGVGGYSLPDDPVHLLLFDRTAQLQGFLGTDELGGFTVRTPRGYTVALASDVPEHTTSTLFHEIAHLLLYSTERALPAWYHEGYAEYLASAILRPGVATLGRPLPDRVKTLQRTSAMDLARLFNTRHPLSLASNDVALFYAEAWAFVHFTQASVQSGRRAAQLDRFVELLEAGVYVASAFRRAFGTSIGRLERRYRLHRSHLIAGDEVLYRHYLFDGYEPEIAFRPASRLEVARELAAAASAIGRFEVAIGHNEEILSGDPGNVEALLGRAVALASIGDFVGAESAVAAIPPRDARKREASGAVAMAHYEQIESSLLDGAEAHARLAGSASHFETAAKRNPSCVRCWEGIALYHARHPLGDPSAGMDALDRAGSISGRSLVRGELLLRMGRFGEARAFVDRTISTTHDRSVARSGRDLLLRIMREEGATETARPPLDR